MPVKIKHLLELARPKHWVKNLIVLFPLFFALRFGSPGSWWLASLALVAFCLASSAVYIVNDIRDRDRDREHPHKKDRPLASGKVGVPLALAEAAFLFAGAMLVALRAGPLVLLIVLAYVLLQVAYTFSLKRKMIVDVVCIALGFVLRAAAGAVAIHVEASPWLIICTFTLCMFLGFCKRRNELATIGDVELAEKHRPTLAGYTPELLTHLITLSAAVAIISYLLYASSPRTVDQFHTTYLVYTLPAVIYAVCRFAMFSMIGKYSDPTDLIMRDWAFQVSVAVWAAATFAIIRWGRHVQEWASAYYHPG